MSEKSQIEGYQELVHTADWALRVWAPDVTHLLVQAAQGMYALLEINHLSGEIIQLPVDLECEGYESLLVVFLSELLYHLEENRLAFENFDLQVINFHVTGFLRGRAAALPVKEIKGVTYHNLAVNFTRAGCTATIVFDV